MRCRVNVTQLQAFLLSLRPSMEVPRQDPHFWLWDEGEVGMERAAQVGCVIVTFSTLCQEAVFTPPWSLSTVATPCLLTVPD